MTKVDGIEGARDDNDNEEGDVVLLIPEFRKELDSSTVGTSLFQNISLAYDDDGSIGKKAAAAASTVILTSQISSIERLEQSNEKV